MRFLHLRPQPGVPGLWTHPELGGEVERLHAPPAPTRRELTGRGRGPVARVALGPLRAIVKRHRRGGLLRGLLPDLFVGSGRAVAEARALERLAEQGLSPRCLALQVSRGLLHALTLAVEEVPGAGDLVELASRDELSPGLARAAGRAVRAMHDAGVAHADLNASNVLARRDGTQWRAWIIDLDGAELRDGAVPDGRRVRDVARLCRSVAKWQETARAAGAARRAFLAAALPARCRGEALRRASRAMRRRAQPLRDST